MGAPLGLQLLFSLPGEGPLSAKVRLFESRMLSTVQSFSLSFSRNWLPSPRPMLWPRLSCWILQRRHLGLPSQALGPSIRNFLPWTIRALNALGGGLGTGSFLCLEAVARRLFNLFQMNVLWRTCCNMYKREISILCWFFFPTLLLLDWGPKKVLQSWGGANDLSYWYFFSGDATRDSRFFMNPLRWRGRDIKLGKRVGTSFSRS